MYHSITFTNTKTGVSKNTYSDWYIVPSARPVFSPPAPKTKYVDIPGADGSIDLTESLAGRPVYNDREGSFDFLVLNDYAIEGPATYDWATLYSNILTFLHGQNLKAVLEDDPTYYYEGRFTVSGWTPNNDYSNIQISYKVSPYKYLVAETQFTLENGTISIDNGTDVVSNLAARTAGNPIQFKMGDILSVERTPSMIGPVDHLSTVLYYGPNANSTYPGEVEGYVHSYNRGGNQFIIPKDGYYRFVLTKWNNGEIGAADRTVLTNEVQIKKGGVL